MNRRTYFELFFNVKSSNEVASQWINLHVNCHWPSVKIRNERETGCIPNMSILHANTEYVRSILISSRLQITNRVIWLDASSKSNCIIYLSSFTSQKYLRHNFFEVNARNEDQTWQNCWCIQMGNDEFRCNLKLFENDIFWEIHGCL